MYVCAKVNTLLSFFDRNVFNNKKSKLEYGYFFSFFNHKKQHFNTVNLKPGITVQRKIKKNLRDIIF